MIAIISLSHNVHWESKHSGAQQGRPLSHGSHTSEVLDDQREDPLRVELNIHFTPLAGLELLHWQLH